MDIAAAVADRLLQIKAIKLSPQKPFTWASGLKSPIYCDNRVLLSFPAIRDFIIEQFVNQAKQFHGVDTIAGVATAGIPHGALIADRLNLPFVYVRSKAKAHGRQNLIEGLLKPGSNVLVIEDLISTGGSSLKAVEALREAEAKVVATLAIFTYSFEQAQLAFEQAQCPFQTLSNYEALLQQAIQKAYISAEEVSTLRSWRLNPQLWSEQFEGN